MRTLRGVAIVVTMTRNAAAETYQLLTSCQASDRSLAQATDRVSHTSSRPTAMASRPSPAPARGGRHPARRAPSQPTTSRSAANSGARPVKCEYSIHASGIHAAIASGRSTSTSATNTHAPVEHERRA